MKLMTMPLILVLVLCSACELKLEGHESLPPVSVPSTPLPRTELAKIRYIQCYSADITAIFDLRLEDLSRMPRFPDISANVNFSNSELRSQLGYPHLGFAQSGYFYEETDARGGYTLSQTFEESDATYDFDMRITNTRSFDGDVDIVYETPFGRKTFHSKLSCSTL